MTPPVGFTATVQRVRGVEVFVGSDGVEYVRATDATAHLAVLPRQHGLPVLYLRRCTAEHVRKLDDRKVRRLEKRTARLKKK